MKQLMLLYAIRKHFPVGHQWQSTQMRRVHLLGFAFPECTSSSRQRQRLLSLRRGSHVYAFVPHYSGPASADPHLAFKFPDQPASHAPTALAPLQLYFSWLLFRQDSTLDADWFRRTVVWHRAALVHAEDRPPRLLSAHQHRTRLCQQIWLMQCRDNDGNYNCLWNSEIIPIDFNSSGMYLLCFTFSVNVEF